MNLELSEELGLDALHEERAEIREEKRQERIEAHEDIIDALDAADYEAWLTAISGTPAEEVLGEIITEDNFDDLVEVHDLIEAGDTEAAEEAAEELGLPEPKQGIKRAMERMGNLLRALFR